MTVERKLILLTNDDGINAEGIRCLKEALENIADCVIVAPADERSACSHAITLHGELVYEKQFKEDECIGYKVWGMPADCVKLALSELFERKPDLIISGINNGANVGISIYYSGTVSAAREGAILGIPSLALSVTSATPQSLAYACSLATTLAQRLLEDPLPAGTLVNVNIPAIDPQTIKGIAVTNQADSYFDEWFIKVDNNGKDTPALVLHGEMILRKPDELNDSNALKNGYVSVTPLRIDLTDHDLMEKTKLFIEDCNNKRTEAVIE
ncbi:5'/3'-nucleotidase SurE [Candidatus Omnitrophota bacterium]